MSLQSSKRVDPGRDPGTQDLGEVIQAHLNPWKGDGTAHYGCPFYTCGQKSMFSG